MHATPPNAGLLPGTDPAAHLAYALDGEGRTVRVTATGPLTPRDWTRLATRLAEADLLRRPTLCVLHAATAAPAAPAAPGDARAALAALLRASRRAPAVGPVALVAPHEPTRRLARQVGAYAAMLGLTVGVFDEVADARRWLDGRGASAA